MKEKNLYSRLCQSIPKIPKPDHLRANDLVKENIELIKKRCPIPFSGSLPHDFKTCAESVIAHRATTKFAELKSLDTRRVAFETYKAHEEVLEKFVETDSLKNLPRGHWINSLRRDIAADLASFDIWEILRTAKIRWSTGSTVVATGGEVSINAKLSCLEHWTTSANNLDYAVYTIYHCRGLKLAAKGFIRSSPNWRSLSKNAYVRHQGKPDVGLRVFRSLLLETNTLRVVDSSRASTVPKNEKTDRFISIEPLFNVLTQACIEQFLRRRLKIHGNDLDRQIDPYRFKHSPTLQFLPGVKPLSTQHLHGALLKYPELDTLDLKNASDSTILYSVEKVFPRHFVNSLINTRSYSIVINGEILYPRKLSSMGNGFTFGLMSYLLFMVGRSLQTHVNVFGDDIIIHKDFTEAYVDRIKTLGYVVNTEKSFISHPFRESCGFYHFIGVGYITCFDIKRCDNLVDMIVTANKWLILGQYCESIGSDLAPIFYNSNRKMLELIPTLSKGPVPISSLLQRQNLGLYAFDSSSLRKWKSTATCRVFNGKVRECLSEHFGGDRFGDFSVVLVPRFKSKPTRKRANKSVETLLSLTGIRKGTIRGEGSWKMDPCLVSPTGSIFRLAAYLGISDSSISLDMDQTRDTTNL